MAPAVLRAFSRRTLLSLFVLAGCDLASEPGGDRPPPAPARIVLADTAQQLSARPGETYGAEVRFLVTTEDARGAADVPVRFSVAEGDGAVSTETAVTDSAGVAAVRVSAGPTPGVTTIVEARVEGVPAPATVHILASLQALVLPADSIVLPAPECGEEVWASTVGPSGEGLIAQTVDFRLRDPGVARLRGVLATGNSRGQRIIVLGAAKGSTELIASWRGMTDTTTVRVASDSIAHFAATIVHWAGNAGFEVDRWEMAQGDTTRISGAAYYPGCVETQRLGADVPDVRATFESLGDPEVLTVGVDGEIVARRPGFTPIVARWRGFADTIVVHVKRVRIEPADTTIFVGDTLRYRAFLTDGEGRETETQIGPWGSGSPEVEALPGFPPALVGRRPGSARVLMSVLNRPRTANVQVRERPAAGTN